MSFLEHFFHKSNSHGVSSMVKLANDRRNDHRLEHQLQTGEMCVIKNLYSRPLEFGTVSLTFLRFRASLGIIQTCFIQDGSIERCAVKLPQTATWFFYDHWTVVLFKNLRQISRECSSIFKWDNRAGFRNGADEEGGLNLTLFKRYKGPENPRFIVR